MQPLLSLPTLFSDLREIFPLRPLVHRRARLARPRFSCAKLCSARLRQLRAGEGGIGEALADDALERGTHGVGTFAVTDAPFSRRTNDCHPERRGLARLLFEFIRASDRAPMSCELRFDGESYGWDVQFFERGEFWYSQRFLIREAAVRWAELERAALTSITE